jgi:MFS family permease
MQDTSEFKKMLLDLTPVRIYRDYRLLFFGQMVSFLGSMISYVAIPYEVYALTKDSFQVGLLGTVQLVPVLVFSLIGGSYADRFDRRRLLLISELLLCLGVLGLYLNARSSSPSLVLIFVIAAFLQSVNAFHRPAMEAMTQKLVAPEHFGAVAALNTFRSSLGAIAGPALGGVLIASFGIQAGYLVDFGTFFFAVLAIYFMRSSVPPERSENQSSVHAIKESLTYAWSKPELVGTYIVDIVAMTFAFPTALFPAMGEKWGGAQAAGVLFSAMSAGSLVLSLASGWTPKVKRQGAAVVIAAALWGAAMIGVGLSDNLWLAAFFLALAGAADSVSGIFRGVIWNQTIPNERRGKLAGLEMISYMTGPLLGNMRAGWMAGLGGLTFSVAGGGILCVGGVIASGIALPKFWGYQKEEREPSPAPSRS